MTVYIPFIIVSAFGAIAKHKKWIYRFALLFLFIISAFRSYIFGGSDSYFYQAFFRFVPTLFKLNINFFSNASYGPGFVLLTSFSKTIYNDYLCFQIITSLVSIALLHHVIKKISVTNEDYTTKLQFLVCYFCYRFIYNNWVSIRQNIANLIIWSVLLSISRQSNKKSYVKMICLIVVASLFHSTAIINIILIPLMLVVKNFDPRKKIMFVIPISLLLFFFSDTIFTQVLNIFTQYIDDRYSHYSTEFTSNVVNYMIRIVCLYLLYININKIEGEKKYIMFDTLFAMCLIGSINVAIVYRFYEYFGIGLYYTLTNVPKMFKKSAVSYLTSYTILVIAMFVIFLRFCITMDSGLYMNYHFFNQ